MDSTRNNKGTPQLIASQHALRGVLAVIVVFYHALLFVGGAGAVVAGVDHAYLLVDIFFMMSGFILCHVYLPSLTGREHGATRRFFGHRVARIAPLYFGSIALYVLITGILVLGGLRDHLFAPGFEARRLAAVIGLAQAWGIGGNSGWNSPSWSISAEAGAYLLFAAFARYHRPDGHAPIILVGVGFALLGWIEARHGSLNIHAWPAGPRGLAGFVIGMGLHGLRDRLTERWPVLETAPLAVGLVVLFLAVPWLPVPDVARLLAMSLLLVSISGDRGPIGGLCRHPWLGRLGHAAYAMYLLQACVILIVTDWINHPSLMGRPEVFGSRFWIEVVVIVIAVPALAIFVHRWFEWPMRRFLRHRFEG